MAEVLPASVCTALYAKSSPTSAFAHDYFLRYKLTHYLHQCLPLNRAEELRAAAEGHNIQNIYF